MKQMLICSIKFDKSQIDMNWNLKEMTMWKIIPRNDHLQSLVYFPFNIYLTNKLNRCKAIGEIYPSTNYQHLKGIWFVLETILSTVYIYIRIRKKLKYSSLVLLLNLFWVFWIILCNLCPYSQIFEYFLVYLYASVLLICEWLWMLDENDIWRESFSSIIQLLFFYNLDYRVFRAFIETD